MWESFPLTVAWRALMRRPAILLVPLAWDLLKWLAATALGPLGLWFGRWDFSVGFPFHTKAWSAHIGLPPALPSVEHLGVALAPQLPGPPSYAQYAAMLAVLLLDAAVKGGFLHVLNEALHGRQPTAAALLAGARQFGWRLFVLAMVWMGYHSGITTLAERGVLSWYLLVPLSAAAVVLLAAAEFVTVAEDLSPPMALIAAPFLLWQALGGIIVAALLAGLGTGALTALAQATGLHFAPLLALLYAPLGALAAATVLFAVQVGNGCEFDEERKALQS